MSNIFESLKEAETATSEAELKMAELDSENVAELFDQIDKLTRRVRNARSRLQCAKKELLDQLVRIWMTLPDVGWPNRGMRIGEFDYIGTEDPSFVTSIGFKAAGEDTSFRLSSVEDFLHSKVHGPMFYVLCETMISMIGTYLGGTPKEVVSETSTLRKLIAQLRTFTQLEAATDTH